MSDLSGVAYVYQNIGIGEPAQRRPSLGRIALEQSRGRAKATAAYVYQNVVEEP